MCVQPYCDSFVMYVLFIEYQVVIVKFCTIPMSLFILYLLLLIIYFYVNIYSVNIVINYLYMLVCIINCYYLGNFKLRKIATVFHD